LNANILQKLSDILYICLNIFLIDAFLSTAVHKGQNYSATRNAPTERHEIFMERIMKTLYLLQVFNEVVIYEESDSLGHVKLEFC